MATGPLKPYSGFDEALKRWGPSGDITTTRDLRWQRDVKGDTQKIKKFQEVVGGLQEFCTYLLMKPGSAFVTVLHLPMKFVAISEATQHLQGRYVGFVGDRTATKDPTQSTWKWDTKTTSSVAAALKAHYAADPTRRGSCGHQTRQIRTNGQQLWRPAYWPPRWCYFGPSEKNEGRSCPMKSGAWS